MLPNELLNSYDVGVHAWDEMYAHQAVRPQYQGVVEFLQQMSIEELSKKEELAKRLFMSQGITFTVYSSGEGIEKIFPFDIIPRIITATEWNYIESGIRQRLKALNLFLKDVYNNQFILKDGIVPIEMVYSCPHFLREMYGFSIPYDIYVHIAGIDLIRDQDGTFYILEDNLRTPSGVSYMLENREITKRIFPDLIPRNNVRTVTEYPDILHRNLVSLSPRQTANPTIVLLTPGIYNSAYFEHTTLARLMGVELVEGRDLVVDNHRVYMKTTAGLNRMVVKKTNESGGYGMLMGNAASEEEIDRYKAAIVQDPRQYIAQPIINLSSAPCYMNGRLKPRRVDLRPYALCGPDGIQIVPGGLTRVALREGSLVVNSSQGGGSKDTWVLAQ